MNPGTYEAKIRSAELVQSQKGRCMLRLTCEVEGQTINAFQMLDGQTDEKTLTALDRVAHLLDWDKQDITALPGLATGKVVQVVVIDDPTYGASVQYVNRADGKRYKSSLTPLAIDRIVELNRMAKASAAAATTGVVPGVDLAKPAPRPANPISDRPQFKSDDIPF